VQHYDALEAPDPEEWLELDEHERIELVRDYHRRARIRLPNEKLHATLHAIVDAQIALGDETPARRIAQRLIGEGPTAMMRSAPSAWCSPSTYTTC